MRGSCCVRARPPAGAAGARAPRVPAARPSPRPHRRRPRPGPDVTSLTGGSPPAGPSTPRAPRESPSQWETRPAPSPLLRPFPFTTPLHPLLYEKMERSGRRKGVAEGKGRSRRFGVAHRGPPEPLGRSPTAPPVTPCRRTHPRWGGWGSWDGLRWGRVQICCKGAPGRDRPREEARNINVSSRTLRRDPGLCNRFGQPAPPGSSPRGGRRLGGGRDERPGDPASRDASPPVHSGRPRRPDVHFALESAVPTVVLECEMHVSTRSPPRRRPGPRAGRPVGTVQEPGRIHSGVALGSRGKSRSSSAQSSALTAGVISGRRS